MAGPAMLIREVRMNAKHDNTQDATTDNGHQKTVSGKNQHGPEDKVGKNAGGNAGSKGQNSRSADKSSVGSHKPGGDGPGTKKFKYEHDDAQRRRTEQP
jgi:hypothetical protein